MGHYITAQGNVPERAPFRAVYTNTHVYGPVLSVEESLPNFQQKRLHRVKVQRTTYAELDRQLAALGFRSLGWQKGRGMLISVVEPIEAVN